ncbi:MAG: sigma-70 family RNA polymerase sigma factor [Acetatifactor sp.]|nr:sigma-70 family RNA polymerase sigma factor [Acetatifactor sp.]
MVKEQFTREVLAAEKNMYYIAKSILGNDEDCADAMQNAILNAYSNLASLREEKYFRTWLTRILINECYSMIRRNKITVSYEEYMEDETSYDSSGYSEVYMEIQALEERYRVPFILHYVAGFTLKEVAGMLKCTEAGIKMRLLRARNILKKQLTLV